MVRITESLLNSQDRYVSSGEAHTFFEIRGVPCQTVYDTELTRKVTKIGPCSAELNRLLRKLSEKDTDQMADRVLLISFLRVHDVFMEDEQPYFIAEAIPSLTAQTDWQLLNAEQQRVILNLIQNFMTMHDRFPEQRELLRNLSNKDHFHLVMDDQNKVERVIIVPF